MSSLGNGGYVIELSREDCLFGRGAPIINYVGNVRFRELVRTRKAEYVGTGRHQVKDQIAKQVIQEVYNRGGRFLRKVESATELKELNLPEGTTVWKHASADLILEKTKQALRDKDPEKPSAASIRLRIMEDSAKASLSMLSPSLGLQSSLGPLPATRSLFPTESSLTTVVPPLNMTFPSDNSLGTHGQLTVLDYLIRRDREQRLLALLNQTQGPRVLPSVNALLLDRPRSDSASLRFPWMSAGRLSSDTLRDAASLALAAQVNVAHALGPHRPLLHDVPSRNDIFGQHSDHSFRASAVHISRLATTNHTTADPTGANACILSTGGEGSDDFYKRKSEETMFSGYSSSSSSSSSSPQSGESCDSPAKKIKATPK